MVKQENIMKKIIIAAAITALFSTMATANSGLADRINEARKYPNKTVSTKSVQMHCIHDKQTHRNMSKSEVKYDENDSGNDESDHAHFWNHIKLIDANK